MFIVEIYLLLKVVYNLLLRIEKSQKQGVYKTFCFFIFANFSFVNRKYFIILL